MTKGKQLNDPIPHITNCEEAFESWWADSGFSDSQLLVKDVVWAAFLSGWNASIGAVYDLVEAHLVFKDEPETGN